MEELKTDTDEPIYENDLVGRTAFENFDIRYLFPWQRLVIANIMEAYTYHQLIKDLTPEERNIFNAENNDSFCQGRQIVL